MKNLHKTSFWICYVYNNVGACRQVLGNIERILTKIPRLIHLQLKWFDYFSYLLFMYCITDNQLSDFIQFGLIFIIPLLASAISPTFTNTSSRDVMHMPKLLIPNLDWFRSNTWIRSERVPVLFVGNAYVINPGFTLLTNADDIKFLIKSIIAFESLCPIKTDNVYPVPNILYVNVNCTPTNMYQQHIQMIIIYYKSFSKIVASRNILTFHCTWSQFDHQARQLLPCNESWLKLFFHHV